MITRIDLQDAYLVEANLRGADLRDNSLIGANFRDADLRGAKFLNADLRGTKFKGALLRGANLRGANLRGASLINTDLSNAILNHSDLTRARLMGSHMIQTDLSQAVLTGADLSRCAMVETNLEGADITRCSVYGISTWNVKLNNARQSSLIITPWKETAIEVDDLQLAQFIYLLLNNQNVRSAIDTITSKVVLILGRFAEERKACLDSIRNELRRLNFIPILFDFETPSTKDLTGTVETLARLARFVIADLTDPSSIPHELATIFPFLRKTPLLPLRLAGTSGYSMFTDFFAYSWVLSIHEYKDCGSLVRDLPTVIAPADKLADKLRGLR